MKKNSLLLLLLVTSLSSCNGMRPVTSGPNPFAITPSRQPLILTATPIFVFPTSSPSPLPPPSFTATLTATSGPTSTSTETPTSTATYIPTASLTPTPGPIEISLLGCETGFDVTHGMGEVTNTYVIISNPGGPDLTNACTTLSSADEGRAHPNKSSCVPSLPTGYQVALKLTIDTTFSATTIIQFSVTSDQGRTVTTSGLACGTIGNAKPADATLGIIQPIQ